MNTQKLYKGIVDFIGEEKDARDFWMIMERLGVDLTDSDIQNSIMKNGKPLTHLMIRFKMGFLNDISDSIEIIKGT